MSRFEILNDGPRRWVLVDSQSDEPSPAFETKAEATDAIDRIIEAHGKGQEEARCDAQSEIDRLALVIQHEVDCVEAAKSEIERLRAAMAKARDEAFNGWSTAAKNTLDEALGK